MQKAMLGSRLLIITQDSVDHFKHDVHTSTDTIYAYTYSFIDINYMQRYKVAKSIFNKRLSGCIYLNCLRDWKIINPTLI